MLRFIRLACLVAVATGMVLPACGGVTKDDKQFSSGLPSNEGLSGLNQTDEARLCNSANGFVRDNASSFCRFTGLLGAAVNVQFDTAVTDENVQQVCATALASCERNIVGDAGASKCRSGVFAPPCTATIGEYEGCVSEEFGKLNQVIAMTPDCSSLTVAYLRPRSSDMSILDTAVLTNGPACKAFKDHCPGAFSSDTTGSSFTSTGSSSTGSPQFPDAGGPGIRCGNGLVDPSEDCDGVNLNEQTCATATMAAFTSGTLTCTSTCRFDLSGCTQSSR
jgi:hypothetical protein